MRRMEGNLMFREYVFSTCCRCKGYGFGNVVEWNVYLGGVVLSMF